MARVSGAHIGDFTRRSGPWHKPAMATKSKSVSAAPTPIPMVDGLDGLAQGYDGFIVDLWGTVHDGVDVLAGAVDCLHRLRGLGKPVLILSNAPRRGASIVERMRPIGIPDDAYDAVFSSGEAAYIALRDRADAFHSGLGRTCFLLGPPEDDSVISGLDYDLAESIKAAHFILVIGSFQRSDTERDYDPMLTAALERRLPMVCANPDLEVLRGGAREICAGAIAQRYESFGGPVHYHGKPHPPIYAASLRQLGLPGDAKVLAIGDAFPTDIAGANAAGLDALMITSGLHAEALGVELFEAPDPARLAALAAEYGAIPKAAAVAFRW